MYLSKKYLSLSRLHAYLEQYKYLNESDRVLEIGNGGGVFRDIASKIATYRVIDIDIDTKPDFVVDVTDWTDITNYINEYDIVYCCQVLEHIPYSDAELAIDNILQLDAKRVVISVPDNRKAVRFKLVFRHHEFSKVFSVPFTGVDRNITNNDEHHWEIWSKNIGQVLELFQKNKKYTLISHYRLFDRHYQHFFILERK